MWLTKGKPAIQRYLEDRSCTVVTAMPVSPHLRLDLL